MKHELVTARKAVLNDWIIQLDHARFDAKHHSPAERALMHDELRALVELRDLMVIRERHLIEEAKSLAHA